MWRWNDNVEHQFLKQSLLLLTYMPGYLAYTSWGFAYLHPLPCCSSIGFIVLGFCNFFIYVLGIWTLILTYAYQSFNCLAISESPLLFFLVTSFHNLDSVTSPSKRHVKTKTHYLVKNDVLRPCKLPSYVDKSPQTWKRKSPLVILWSTHPQPQNSSQPSVTASRTLEISIHFIFLPLTLKIHCNE